MDEGGVPEQAGDVLRDLRERVGRPGYEALAARHGALSKSSVGNLLTGATSPRDATVLAFIEACLGHGARRLPAEQRDRDFWWQRYRRALRVEPEPVDTPVAGYLDAVRTQFGRLQLDALIPLNDQEEHPPVHLRDVFVGQDVRANPPRAELPRDVWLRLIDSGHLNPADLPTGFDRDLLARLRQDYRQRPRRSVLAVLAHPSALRTVLLGDPGSGKSTLARYLALALADAVPPPPELEPLRGLVPLVVELRIYAAHARRGGDFLDLIDHLHVVEGLGLPRATAESLLVKGRALVVFDGLDEVFDPDERTAVAKRIGVFTARYPQVKVVVTSRVVGYQRVVLDTAGFAHHKLEDLTTAQVEDFVRRWFDTALPEALAESARLRRRLMAAVAESKAVSELAGNPLLLTILAIIGRRHELPRDRRAVYKHAVTVLVQHWDPNKYLLANRFSADLPTIVEEDKLELLRRVARRMQAAPAGLAGNHIPGADLVEEFERYLHDRLELPAHQARPGAEQMLEQFRHRNFILSRFGPGVYGFVHRAFLEYLAAEDVKQRFDDRKLDESDLLQLFATRWDDPAWHEVLRHVTGMLSEDFARLVIEHLLGLNPDWRRQRRALPHHVVLALQCLGEVRRLGTLAGTSRAVMAAVTDTLLVACVRQRNYDSTLTQLLENSLPSALAGFGPYWAGREVYRSWFAEHHRFLTLQANYSGAEPLVLATRLAVLLSGDDDALHGVLLDQARSGVTPAVRLAAISGLTCGEEEKPEINALLRTLATGDQDGEVRAAALAGLKRWLGPADARWVRDMVSEGAWYEVVITAVAVVAEKWADDEDTLPWLQDLLARRVADYTVAEVLASRWSPDSGVLAWLRALVEESPSVRTEAIKAVGAGWAHVGGVREWLVDLAENGPRDARDAAVAAIGSAWRGDRDVIRWLRGRLSLDPVGLVRRTAVYALGEGGLDPETEEELRRRVCRDPSEDVRQAAAEVLAKHAMSSELCDWFRSVLATEHAGFVRKTLVDLLSQAHGPSAWARSIALNDPQPHVRLEAMRVMVARSEEPDLLDWLLKMVRTEPSSYTRTAIVEMIVEGWSEQREILDWLRTEGEAVLGGSVALDGLAAGWSHEPWFVERLRASAAPGNQLSTRFTALDYLGVQWAEESEDLLSDMLRSDVNPSIRGEVFKQLVRRMGDSRAELEWMREVLVEDYSATVRMAAFEAIAKRGHTSAPALAWVEATITSGSLGELHEQVVYHLEYVNLSKEFLRGLLVGMAERSPSDAVREAAVNAAIRHMDLAVVAAWLRERFDRETSPRVRRAVLHKLGWAGDADVVEWLREVATSDESEIVRVQALVHTADRPADLQACYATVSDRSARRELLKVLVGRWRFEEGVEEWFVATAQSAPSAQARAEALLAYAWHWQVRPGLLDWLWDRLDDPAPQVRCAAVKEISGSWTHIPGVLTRLCALDDPDLTVRLTLFGSAEGWDDPNPAVLEWARDRAQNDPDPTARAAALQVVAELSQGSAEVVGWLVERVAEDDHWEPRNWAIWLAMLMGGHQPEVLAWIRDLALHDEDPMVRGAAVESWALGWAARPDERADLARAGAEDPRPDVRVAAVRALGGARPQDPDISAWLRERARDPDPGVARAAVQELDGRIPVPPIPKP